MSAHSMFVAGFGGQGILLIGQMLAQAGMLEGKEVTFLPSYGPEMRGGTANCTVILSDKPISCPVIDQASCVVVMNHPSMLKFESLVAPGGHLFVNTSLVTREASRSDVIVHKVDATEIAKKVGDEKSANMVMLGAVIDHTGVVSRESMDIILKQTFSGSKAKLSAINKKAFTAWTE